MIFTTYLLPSCLFFVVLMFTAQLRQIHAGILPTSRQVSYSLAPPFHFPSHPAHWHRERILNRKTPVQTQSQSLSQHDELLGTTSRPECPVLLNAANPSRNGTSNANTTRLVTLSTTYSNPQLTTSTSLAKQTTGRQQPPRIIGGSPLDANHSLLPYVALLYTNKTGEGSTSLPLCTAIVIAPRLVLTAAHCTYLYFYYNNLPDPVTVTDPEDISIKLYFGSTRRAFPLEDGIERGIKAVYSHPRFTLSNEQAISYDIAYLKLYEDVPAGTKMMKVNTNRKIPSPGAIVRNTGYGLHQYIDLAGTGSATYNGEDETITQLDIPVMRYTYCADKWRTSLQEELPGQYIPNFIHDRYHICAGYLHGGCSSCNGDSGGPIIQYDRTETPVLLGIASMAYKCGTNSTPTVYLRVSEFVDSFIPPDRNIKWTNSTQQTILDEDEWKGPFPNPDYNDDGNGDGNVYGNGDGNGGGNGGGHGTLSVGAIAGIAAGAAVVVVVLVVFVYFALSKK